MIKPIGFIPSLFTVLNLFCGFMSIVNAETGNIQGACLYIIYAALFDMTDGIAARFTGTSSKFGVELDSLADVVSFGAAPSFILYKAFYFNHGGLGIALASLIMIFAALRLARFNASLAGFDKAYFTGVPVPISAVTVSSFFMFHYNKNFSHELSVIFIYIMSVLLPLLMISRFRYDTVPKISLRTLKKQPVKFTLIFIILIMLIITKGEGLFAFCMFYLSSGIFRSVKNLISRIGKHRENIKENEIEFKSAEGEI